MGTLEERHEELAVDLNKKAAEITSTLARADDSGLKTFRMELIKEQELYFSMDLSLLSNVIHPSAEIKF